MKIVMLFSTMLFSFLSIDAQVHKEYVETGNAKKSLQLAQRFVSLGQFDLAKKQLEYTIKIKDDFAVAYRELGIVLLELHEYQKAIESYEKSFELDSKLSRAAFYECGEAYFKLGQPDQALAYFDKFKNYDVKNYANKEKEAGLEYTYDTYLEERIENCAFIANIDSSLLLPSPINLGSAINSDKDEYLPTITSDGLQLVYTRQIKYRNEDVMISKFKDGTWQNSKPFGKTINTSSSEGMAKFETHGKAFYFSGCMRPDTEGGCDIYQALLENGDVSEVKRVDGFLNSEYWDSQPSITCDGKFMFFSSSRKDGFGGADLYMSELNPKGYWEKPKNLGPNINTDGDEEAPFISTDGATLYFSSNGHQGQGEGDLFVTRKSGSGWLKPENLGYPINTPAKELGFYVQGDGKTAYMSSARGGGEGGLDIYVFELPEHLRPQPTVHLEGYVKNGETGEPVETNVVISNQENKWIMRSDKTGWFFLCLPGNETYSFQANEEQYNYYLSTDLLNAQENISAYKKEIMLYPIPKPEIIKQKVKLKQKQIQFFFDFDSYQLNPNVIIELEKLIAFLKQDNSWEIEVVGYADSKGNADYNKKLSQKRAGAIVDYLKKEGINIKVIRNEGKGSVSSDKAEDMQFRRVDVILSRS
jgi:outer membrane protein OmpA-like peptidoglycan-associated protein/tetratricopeptide (TPR) repeat protein